MSDAVFVDTSGWASYFDGDDPRHAVVAASVVDALRQQHTLVTTNYIITEVVALFSSRRLRIPHAELVAAMTLIKTEPGIRIEYIDQAADEEA